MYLFLLFALLMSFSLPAAEMRKEIAPKALKDTLFEAIRAKDIDAVRGLYATHSPEELQAIKEEPLLFTALMWAIEFHAPQIVAFLLQHGEDPESRDINRRTPLMLAVNEGDIPMTKMLLDAGAEVTVNSQDINGITALMRTGIVHSPELAKLLVGVGANKDLKSKDKKTVFDYGEPQSRELFKNAIEEGVKQYAIQNELWVAIKDNKCERFELLLHATPPADLETRRVSRTLLMYAVQKHRDKIVDLLIKKKVNIAAQDNEGFTALMFAALEGSVQFIEKLIAAEADINQKNFAGSSALSLAIEFADNEKALRATKIVPALLAYGADVNTQNEEGITPFMGAVIKNFPQVVKELVAFGANPEAVNNDGDHVLDHYPRLNHQRQQMLQAIAEGKKEYARRLTEKSTKPRNITEEKMEEEKINTCNAQS